MMRGSMLEEDQTENLLNELNKNKEEEKDEEDDKTELVVNINKSSNLNEKSNNPPRGSINLE